MITGNTTSPAIGLLAADSYTDLLGQCVLTRLAKRYLLQVFHLTLQIRIAWTSK